jgi:hypothetical protein
VKEKMTNLEHLEKMRQAVMRMRELLDILHGQTQQAEKGYAKLFAHLSEAEQAKPEKDRQRLAALPLLDDAAPLSQLALTMRWQMHEMNKEFEQLYDNTLIEADDDEA